MINTILRVLFCEDLGWGNCGQDECFIVTGENLEEAMSLAINYMNSIYEVYYYEFEDISNIEWKDIYDYGQGKILDSGIL